MALKPAAILLILAAISGCTDTTATSQTTEPPFVKTIEVTGSQGATLGLSGTVRARIESPLSFQVNGRIITRAVDAGHQVEAQDLLFELDKRDLEASVRAAEADVAAATSALAIAESDLERHRQLLGKGFVSQQALDRAELSLREARSRRDVALTRLNQAQNAFGYGELRAPAAGILIDVTGEVGQVVAAGQPVAVLAHSGGREVEVFFPEGVTPPATGEVTLGLERVPLKLREKAGAVDAQGRTLRARYTITEASERFMLGSVVRAHFTITSGEETDFTVPLAAINERGEGPRVWVFNNNQVTSVPVTILSIEAETAQIRGPLQVGDRIVALGTHLLTENMPVRALGQ